MRIFFSVALMLLLWIFLGRCVIMQNRISDAKGRRWFKAKNVDLTIRDTLIDGRHIHYAMTGDVNLPTLIFIHGSPGSWFHYMKFMYDSALLKKFHIVSFDRPGFGYSDFGKPMHLAEQSKLLLRVIETMKNDKPLFLAGHSMGAPIVAQMAIYKSELFTKIVLIAAPIDAKQEAKETWRHLMEIRPLYWCLPGAFAPSNTELLYLKKDLIPFADELKKITCPVLFIHGDKDTWVPIQNIAFGKRMMINAKSIMADTLHGADHQIPWKRRDEMRDILLQLY